MTDKQESLYDNPPNKIACFGWGFCANVECSFNWEVCQELSKKRRRAGFNIA